MSRSVPAFAIALAALALCAQPLRAANWTVIRVNHMLLTPPGGTTVQEMSGVTYVGPAGDAFRFIAAEQTKGELVRFDVSIDASGALTAISNVTAIDISSNADLEGIAYTNPTRNSVFVSDEIASGPRVLEVNLANGFTIQTASIPPVFTANERTNRGFESLARSLDATEMWTANEEALTVDGPVATPDAGTVVRLLRLGVSGNTLTADQQFAYPVDAMHGPYYLGRGQSGLSDLALMPDGTLLALERSLGDGGTIAYRNRIYEIDRTSATDVSGAAFAAGLIGQTYTPVAKHLLWQGAADAAAGQNLEGLALGPRLADGRWLLIGVVDDQPGDLDTLSANTVVAFVASPVVSADFDGSGEIDGADFLAWQRGVGKTVGANLTDGDADRDGDVDAADLAAWRAAASVPANNAVPEPAGAALMAPAIGGLLWARSRRRRTATR
jgi:hypothetical protein